MTTTRVPFWTGHQKDVLALEIAMDDAGSMRGRERRDHLTHDRQALGGGEGALAPNATRERLAFEKLHREIDDRGAVRARVIADVVDPADVGVSDLARQVDLALEALDGDLVGGVARMDRFEGHRLAELEVLGFVHFAHSTPRDEPADAVALRDQLVGLEERCWVVVPDAGWTRAASKMSTLPEPDGVGAFGPDRVDAVGSSRGGAFAVAVVDAPGARVEALLDPARRAYRAPQLGQTTTVVGWRAASVGSGIGLPHRRQSSFVMGQGQEPERIVRCPGCARRRLSGAAGL